jgi:peptidoglycan/LPS O-acetylase OafA/YrhL
MGVHQVRLSKAIQNGPGGAKARFEVLDSWRGICALFVALFHLPLAAPIGENGFVRGSFLFVDFFFVLSGFVIAHSYTNRVNSGQELKSFLITRFGRLFPLHTFMLGAFVAFEFLRFAVPQLSGGQAPFSGAFSLEMLPANLTLIHGLGLANQLTWNAPSWSISTELFAYLFFALSIMALGRRAWLAFGLMLIVGPILLFRFSPDYMDATYDLGLVRCLFGFSAGVTTHAIMRGNMSVKSDTRESRIIWTLSELIVIVALVLFVSTSFDNAGSLLAPFIFAFAVALFAHEGGYVSRVLSLRPFLKLGAISYSIYLTHIFIQGRMLNAAKLLDNEFGLNLLSQDASGASKFSATYAQFVILLMILITIASSYLTYRLIEVPGRDYFRRLARKGACQINQTRPYGASTSS